MRPPPDWDLSGHAHYFTCKRDTKKTKQSNVLAISYTTLLLLKNFPQHLKLTPFHNFAHKSLNLYAMKLPGIIYLVCSRLKDVETWHKNITLNCCVDMDRTLACFMTVGLGEKVAGVLPLLISCFAKSATYVGREWLKEMQKG